MKKCQDLFINRDISWLEFNLRVLNEAMDSGTPLLEQAKFLAIFSSNLDEFFMVRMAGIASQKQDVPQIIYKKEFYIPSELYSCLDKRIRLLVTRQYRWLNNVILPRLADENIVVTKWDNLSQPQQEAACKIFERDLLPVLTPIGIDPSHPFPLLPNLGLELLIRLSRPVNGQKQERFAVVEVPSVLPRFFRIESAENRTILLPAEDLIAANLTSLFSGCDIHECTPFRITRDMDFSIDEESAVDVVTEMQITLQKKTRRSIIRLEVASGISRRSKDFLVNKLQLNPAHIYFITGLLNLKSLFQLFSFDHRKELTDPEMPPLPCVFCPNGKSMFDSIKDNGPFFTHLPYESFNPVIRLLEEAASDPDVLAIKQTLYRVSGNSPVVNALIKAARNGKQVTVLFEIKARFDEENNIRRAGELAEAGAHVIYGIAHLKVHCKALLIVRKEPGGIHRYAHLSTGNYNDKTARQYTDIGYFTDDNALTQDVASLFNVITGFSDPPMWNKLIVAPFNMKEKLIWLIDRERSISTPQNPGHIIIKANAIIDYELIEHLYEAAKHHVKIELIIRGICGLNPFALPKGSDSNIKIISILDRFLEHSRIYYFRNNDDPDYYLGSADVMPRNLRRRIELLFPVNSPENKQELDFILQTALNDKRKGRRLSAPNKYSGTPSAGKYEDTRSQYVLYQHYKNRADDFSKKEKNATQNKLTIFEHSPDYA